MKNYYGIVMAGGVGSRFWPASTTDFPKQFHDLLGNGRSLLQNTYERLTAIIPQDNIMVLTNERYTGLVRKQLPYLQDKRIVGEPAMRNTAPAILLAALKVQQENPDGIMVIAPSDHLIANNTQFWDDLQTCLDACDREDILMTMGILPDSPHTGYGYIEQTPVPGTPISKVACFVEKPDVATAQQYLDSGNFLWNAGIFIWKASAIVSAFAKAQPSMHQLFLQAGSVLNTSQEQAWLSANYAKAEDISIDYAILEKVDHVSVLPVDFGWNDLGAWSALYDQGAKDNNGNVANDARTLLENSSNNVIHTGPDHKVVAVGLEDYIVVVENGIVLIAPRDQDQHIKQLKAAYQDKFHG